MFSKLNRIHKTPSSRYNCKKLLPSFDLKTKPIWGLKREKKLEKIKINKYLKNKINNQSSFYNSKKLDKDYEQSQSFKKNICEFPSINFTKNRIKNYSSPYSISNGNDNNKKFNTSILGSSYFLKDTKFKNANVHSRKINYENQKNAFYF